MGKKVKAKPKNPRKAQERDPPASSSEAGPGDAASQDASHSAEEAAASASGREHCGHYGRDIAHLDKVLLEILSSKHVASCEHCREDAPRKKGGAGGKQKKKGGASKGATAKAQAKAEKSDTWVCLDCGRHFCGGAVEDTKPYGHARRHAKQDRHWWAARYDDPTVAYCLSCEKEVSIEMPKLETVVAAAVEDKEDKVVGADDTNSWRLINPDANVIKGLPNLGNTCFFNAVLQSLLAVDRLRRKMLGPDVPTGALAMSLKKLFAETSASNHAGGALSPKNLFSSICSKYPQFRGYQMQDSHELLRCFLDGLRTEETEARKLAEETSDAGVPTIVDSIFGGQLSSTVSSTECSHSSVKHDQFLDLSLPVPSRRPPAKSVSSPPAKRTKQSIRDRNKSHRYGKVPARASPSVESKEQIQTIAERNNSQIPGSELEQVVSEREAEPSGCSESCGSVSNQERNTTTNVDDSICWLDYLADADETKSEILDSADSTGTGQIWECRDATDGPLHPQDDALPKEQILGSEHSGENTVDDDASLQTVILLPYKELGTTAKEGDETIENSNNSECAVPPLAVSPVTENNTQPGYCGDVEQDDYVGLGDMFNEPEVTSEVKKEASKEDIDVMAWSSNSADDEVDDSNAPVSVEGCMALYTEPELLSEPWLCEHCTNAARVKADERKNVMEMTDGANEIKDGEEMMAGGDGRKDGEKLIESCSKQEGIDQVMGTDGCKNDIDQIMTTGGCSDNVHSDMNCKEGRCVNPSLADPEQNCDCNFPDTENTSMQRSGAVFTMNETEQSSNQTNHKDQCMDLKSLELESSSLNNQQHDSPVQYNDGHNVDITTKAASAPLSCGGDSVSCNATNNVEAQPVGGTEEVVSSSLPSDAQKTVLGAKDNEDAITKNQGRRKRMKMVGKAQLGQDNQNKQKEDETKVFRAALRRILISKAPPVLTINLNRFSQDSHGRYKKLKGHVRFKEMLDIQPFMDPRCKENNNSTYRLVGVVEHLGTMTGGHYIAYVRACKIGGRQQQCSGSKSWFYASDGQVREASLEEVLNCEAYILFYERVGD